MSSPEPTPAPVYRVDQFEVDLRAGELRRNGVRVPLQDLPLRLLGILAEHAGQVVTREEIQQRLWQGETFVDFEDGLNTAIRKLRQAVDDDARQPRLIETIRGYGYRLLVPVEFVPAPHPRVPSANGVTPSSTSQEAVATVPETDEAGRQPPAAAQRPAQRWLRWVLGTSAAILISGMLFALWWLTPLPPPTIVNVVPITTTGRVDTCWPIITDGARLFYLERAGDHWNLMQTSMTGGEPQPVPVPFPNNMMVFDVSPDRSQLLVGTFEQRDEPRAVYTMPVQGGPPVRLGALVADGVKWSPNGGKIAYFKVGELWTSNVDGSQARLIAKVFHIDWLNWSPDGLRLRFTSSDALTTATSLWEVNVNGGNLHQVLPGWSDPPSERRGGWSADGRDYVFTSKHDGRFDVWMLRERSDSWRRSPAGPFRLTDGPFNVGGVTLSPDHKRIYFCGLHPVRELDEFDPTTGHVAPFLPRLGPNGATFSHDGQWMASLNSVHQLVRSRADGSDPRLLTPPTMSVDNPRFSPDGQTIAFEGQEEGKPSFAYLINRDGGVATPLTSLWPEVHGIDWSPDGQAVIVSRSEEIEGSVTSVLARIDIQSRHESRIPGDNQFGSTRWSPAGRFIAATSENGRKLNVFDIGAGQWRVVATGKAFNVPVWSSDGRYLYYQELLGPGEPLYRLHPEGGPAERVTDFSPILASGANRCAFIDFAPNGHLLVTITRANGDLYAAELR